MDTTTTTQTAATKETTQTHDGRYSVCDSCTESGVLGVNLAENQPGSAHAMGGSTCIDTAACFARYDAAMAPA